LGLGLRARGRVWVRLGLPSMTSDCCASRGKVSRRSPSGVGVITWFGFGFGFGLGLGLGFGFGFGFGFWLGLGLGLG